MCFFFPLNSTFSFFFFFTWKTTIRTMFCHTGNSLSMQCRAIGEFISQDLFLSSQTGFTMAEPKVMKNNEHSTQRREEAVLFCFLINSRIPYSVPIRIPGLLWISTLLYDSHFFSFQTGVWSHYILSASLGSGLRGKDNLCFFFTQCQATRSNMWLIPIRP